MFWAEPFICVKKPIVASWHTLYKKPNGECESKSMRYMRSHKSNVHVEIKLKLMLRPFGLSVPSSKIFPHFS